MSKCPCGSGKLFSACCQRFLSGVKHAKTPEQLMRSRYSAFSLGGYGAYLLATWSERMRGDLSAVDLSHQSVEWIGLEVLSKSQQADSAVVEFEAHFIESGVEHVHHERSRFERVNGRWFYIDGGY